MLEVQLFIFSCVYSNLWLQVTKDEDTQNLKGKTLFNENERAEQVSHCRYADEVVARCPWVIDQAFIDEYQIDFVVHGEDQSYDENGDDAYAFVKSIGKFKTVARSEGVSTTDVIVRIIKDYKGYVERSIGRGYTHQQLNIEDDMWEKIREQIDTKSKYPSE